MNKNKKKKGMLTVLIVICLVIAAAFVFLILRQVLSAKDDLKTETKSSISSSVSDIRIKSEVKEKERSENGSSTEQEKTDSEDEKDSTDTDADMLSNDLLRSEFGYMVKVSDESTVLDKRSTERIYPASMTKVMTALVALEQLPDLDEEIVMKQELIDEVYLQEASMAGFVNNESVTVRDMLYGVILPSGGEACLALADRISGSEEGFVELMNQKAAELGMTDTHYTNSTGLHDDQHYTSCKDTEILFKAALENESFYQIITADEYRCRADEYYPDGLYLKSTMFKLLAGRTPVNNAVILGGKTGTTDEAGYCLVSFGQYKGESYILVTAKAPIDDSDTHYNIIDALNVYGALK